MEVDIEINSLKDALWRLTTRVYVLEDFITKKFGSTVLGSVHIPSSNITFSHCNQNVSPVSEEADEYFHPENSSFQNVSQCQYHQRRAGKRKCVQEMLYCEVDSESEKEVSNTIQDQQLDNDIDSQNVIVIKTEPQPQPSNISMLEDYTMDLDPLHNTRDETDTATQDGFMLPQFLENPRNEYRARAPNEASIEITQLQLPIPDLQTPRSKPAAARRESIAAHLMYKISENHSKTLKSDANGIVSNNSMIAQLKVKPGYCVDTKNIKWSNFYTYIGHLGPSTMKWQCVTCSTLVSVASSSYCNAYRHYLATHNQDIRRHRPKSKPNVQSQTAGTSS